MRLKWQAHMHLISSDWPSLSCEKLRLLRWKQGRTCCNSSGFRKGPTASPTLSPKPLSLPHTVQLLATGGGSLRTEGRSVRSFWLDSCDSWAGAHLWWNTSVSTRAHSVSCQQSDPDLSRLDARGALFLLLQGLVLVAQPCCRCCCCC